MLKNILFLFFISYNLFANQKANTDTLKFVFEPDSIFLHIGETGVINVKMVKENGELAQSPFLIYGQPYRKTHHKIEPGLHAILRLRVLFFSSIYICLALA